MIRQVGSFQSTLRCGSSLPSMMIHLLLQSIMMTITKLLIPVCINVFLWVACLCCVVVVCPFFIPYWVAKFLEQWIFTLVYGAVPVGSKDVVWLQNSLENEAIITALLTIEGEIQVEYVRKVMYDKLVGAKCRKGSLLFPKGQRFLQSGYLNYFWIQEENFDIQEHVRRLDQCARSKLELESIIRTMRSQPLRKSLSPWEVVLVRNVESSGKKTTALLFRIHHAIADGISLCRFLTHLFADDKVEETPLRVLPLRARLLLQLKGVFWMPWQLACMLMLPSNQTVPGGVKLTGKRKFSWSPGLPLDVIKRIKNKAGVTVNDVVMTCFTGALRDNFLSRGEMPPKTFTIYVPINTRLYSGNNALSLDNDVTPIPIVIPARMGHQPTLLYKIRHIMNEVKSSGKPVGGGIMVSLATLLWPDLLSRPILDLVASKASYVISNVPGPRGKIYIGGHELLKAVFWPPGRAEVGFSFSVISYTNKVFVGVSCDDVFEINPEEISANFEVQLKRLSNEFQVKA